MDIRGCMCALCVMAGMGNLHAEDLLNFREARLKESFKTLAVTMAEYRTTESLAALGMGAGILVGAEYFKAHSGGTEFDWEYYQAIGVGSGMAMGGLWSLLFGRTTVEIMCPLEVRALEEDPGPLEARVARAEQRLSGWAASQGQLRAYEAVAGLGLGALIIGYCAFQNSDYERPGRYEAMKAIGYPMGAAFAIAGILYAIFPSPPEEVWRKYQAGQAAVSASAMCPFVDLAEGGVTAGVRIGF